VAAARRQRGVYQKRTSLPCALQLFTMCIRDQGYALINLLWNVVSDSPLFLIPTPFRTEDRSLALRPRLGLGLGLVLEVCWGKGKGQGQCR
jgi:hypothetical protein